MLQFTYKLKLTERVKAKCSRHPRYNPVKDGRAFLRYAKLLLLTPSGIRRPVTPVYFLNESRLALAGDTCRVETRCGV